MQLEVDAMQAEAASARAAAESSQAAVLEVERLGQDNSLLAARLSQMDLDLQVGLPALQESNFPATQPCIALSVERFRLNMESTAKLTFSGPLKPSTVALLKDALWLGAHETCHNPDCSSCHVWCLVCKRSLPTELYPVQHAAICFCSCG